MAGAPIQRIDTNTPEMDYLLEIYGMANGTHVINTATKLGIFELLYQEEGPISAEDLGQKNKFKPDVLARLLNCLTALKMVVKVKEDEKVLYHNTKAGDLLAESNPNTLKMVPVWLKDLGGEVDVVVDKIKLTESEENKGEEGGFEGWDDWENTPADFDMYQGLHNILVPQAKQLVTHHDLKDYKSCLDLGGGTGVIAFELRRQYPEMDVTVMELKNVVKLAEERFVPGNEHLGVKFIPGNFFKIPFPNVDLCVVAAVLRGMNSKERDELISKCFQALNPGGAILALEQMQNEERDGTVSATAWDLSYYQLDGGLPTPSEYTALFNKHGFKEVTCTFTQNWNDYDIIFAKKGKSNI